MQVLERKLCSEISCNFTQYAYCEGSGLQEKPKKGAIYCIAHKYVFKGSEANPLLMIC